jgi:hypothetical protein
LETIRTDLRKSEEAFKSDLKSKESQIETLRSGALSGLVSRQTTLDKRRLEAVDQIWSSITTLSSGKGVTAMVAAIKFDAAAEIASRNENLRKIFAQMGSGCDPQKINNTDAMKARPYVSDIAWALFSAYQAIVATALAKLELLKAGVNMKEAILEDNILKLINVALPQYKEYIAKYGLSASQYLLDELEARLLDELRKILQGVESDKASVEQAAAILKETQRVMKSVSQSTSS